MPEQVQLKYLAFLGKDYAAAAKVSDADVADYYERHKSQWTKDNKVQPLAEVRERIAAELRTAGGMYAAADEAKKAHDNGFDAYLPKPLDRSRLVGILRKYMAVAEEIRLEAPRCPM